MRGASHRKYRRPMAPQAAGKRARLLQGTGLAGRRERLAGTSTAILEAGSGSPLILLHGGIECGGVYWAPVIAHLAEQRGLVVPDLPGLGESEPVPRLDADTFANWLGALVSATCEEPPTFVAHSLLGSLAVRFAAERGDSLRGLLVYGAPGVGPYRMPRDSSTPRSGSGCGHRDGIRNDLIAGLSSISSRHAAGTPAGSRRGARTRCPGHGFRTSSGRCDS